MSKVAKWKQLTKEEFAQKVKECRSFGELAEKLGYSKKGGGTQKSLKKAVKEYGLDVSHFSGQGWNKENYNYALFNSTHEMKNGKQTLAALLKIKERKCECCGRKTWLNRPINLEVHHIDGNHFNNDLNNLQLLCPNCHSYTDSYCGRNNNVGVKKVDDETLVKALKECKSICQALRKVCLYPGGGNYKRANELIVKYQITKFLN